MTNFENTLKDSIITAYITVYGEEKWNALSNEEKDIVLHIVLNDFAKVIL